MVYENDKTIRLKYIRHLEKFFKRTIPLLKHKDFNIELFIIAINKYYDELKEIKSIRLNSDYLKLLEEYINLVLHYTSFHSLDFDKERKELLHKANLLHKEKNKTTYKKIKHKKSYTKDDC